MASSRRALRNARRDDVIRVLIRESSMVIRKSRQLSHLMQWGYGRGREGEGEGGLDGIRGEEREEGGGRREREISFLSISSDFEALESLRQETFGYGRRPSAFG